jgi:hypothetical protein
MEDERTTPQDDPKEIVADGPEEVEGHMHKPHRDSGPGPVEDELGLPADDDDVEAHMHKPH